MSLTRIGLPGDRGLTRRGSSPDRGAGIDEVWGGDGPGPARFRFATPEKFHLELRRRVDEYFAGSGVAPFGSRGMYVKTVLMVGWLIGSYLCLVFVPMAWWQAVPLAISLAIAGTGIGISVQHDANHSSYSRSRTLNRLVGMTLDLIGASSSLWRYRHNTVHHTYTNISGFDADIDFQPYLRLAPDQPRRRFHRAQHLYAWLLYALLPAYWQFLADYRDLYRGTIRGRPFPRPKGFEFAGIFLGKLVFYGWSLALPMFFHPVWAVLAIHALASLTMGVLLTSLFQLAHCVTIAEFREVTNEPSPAPVGWAENQVRATVNFAPGNRLLSWYCGGLNYQIEHHLFPRVCHRHYPQLSRVVVATCADFDIPYRSHPSLRTALASHIEWLIFLGRD